MKTKKTPSSTMTAIKWTRGGFPLLPLFPPMSQPPASFPRPSIPLPLFLSYSLSVVQFFSLLFFRHLLIIAGMLLTPFIFCHCRFPAKRIHVGN